MVLQNKPTMLNVAMKKMQPLYKIDVDDMVILGQTRLFHLFRPVVAMVTVYANKIPSAGDVDTSQSFISTVVIYKHPYNSHLGIETRNLMKTFDYKSKPMFVQSMLNYFQVRQKGSMDLALEKNSSDMMSSSIPESISLQRNGSQVYKFLIHKRKGQPKIKADK